MTHALLPACAPIPIIANPTRVGDAKPRAGEQNLAAGLPKDGGHHVYPTTSRAKRVHQKSSCMLDGRLSILAC